MNPIRNIEFYLSRNRVKFYLFLGVILFLWIINATSASFRDIKGSDVVRQWINSKYVSANLDPFSLCLEILEYNFSADSFSNSHPVLFAVPRNVPSNIANQILDYGYPESTYPPSSLYLISLLIGHLDDSTTVICVLTFLNAISFILGIILLFGIASPTQKQLPKLTMLLVSVVSMFPPFYLTFERGQFGILVLTSLLCSLFYVRSNFLSGALFAIALIKPSIALPFIILFLLEKKLFALTVAFLFHLLFWFQISLSVGTDPIETGYNWLKVTKYFVSGMYSIQDVINYFELGNVAKSISGSFVLLAWTMVILTQHHRKNKLLAFSFIALVSALWTYHSPYDLVLIAPIIIHRFVQLLRIALIQERRFTPFQKKYFNFRLITELLIFMILSAAFSNYVLASESPISRIIRWSARFILVFLFLSSSNIIYLITTSRTYYQVIAWYQRIKGPAVDGRLHKPINVSGQGARAVNE